MDEKSPQLPEEKESGAWTAGSWLLYRSDAVGLHRGMNVAVDIVTFLIH